jgi:NitT/TauT family transport system substrate-binding protein
MTERRRVLGWTARLAGAGLVAGLTGGLTGCARREPLLRVATNVWPGYELMHAARALGQIDEHRIRLVELPSATEVLRALSAGTVEAAGLTLDELLSARAQGVSASAVLVLDVSNGADALVARAGIDSLATLKGRRIGVEQSAVGGLMLREALDRAGLRIEDIKPVALTNGDHLRAWDAGQIDAVVSFEPVLGQLERRGARRLFDSHALPDTIVDVLAVGQAALKASPQAIRQLIQAHFAMRERWRADPAGLAPTLAGRLDLPTEQVGAAFAGLSLPDLAENRAWLGGNPSRLTAAAQRLATGMLGSRLLDGPPSFENLVNGRFLPGEDPT